MASPAPAADGLASASASASAPTPERHASARARARPPRSCVACRRRKVRCDRASPCARCRRAGVACTFPSDLDRPPARWARRLDLLPAPDHPPQGQAAAGVVVLDRLRALEGLVAELRGRLEAPAQAGGTRGRDEGAAPAGSSPAASAAGVSREAGVQQHQQPGRMVLREANRGRYVSSGFWSRIDDELRGLKMDLVDGDLDASEDEDPPEDTTSSSTRWELDRAPSERHAFLFQHNLSGGPAPDDPRRFHPLPSQTPFLLNTYAENVNMFVQIVHMPTVTKMVREWRARGDMSTLTPANEALLFAMYYAAITSMEEEDVMDNFGTSKGELSRRFRLGLEHALARADFLNVPDLVLVQAFVVFLSLLRRHESPRFVWVLVGLAVRLAQALGLHRDGAHFGHLGPYEVEIRRRVWWAICVLDVRASEDQGTEYTIPAGSFDTRLPLNVGDADIGPDVPQPPEERQSRTDMTFAVDTFKICEITRRMMAPGSSSSSRPSLAEQVRLVDELYTTLEQGYLRHSAGDDGDVARWVGTTAVRLTMAKMSLMIHLPALAAGTSSSPAAAAAAGAVRDRLLVAAVEVAEYNHALNAEHACRQWRWMYQTYTHWHAVVLLLLEIARRPLSPLVERAWVALHSPWLVPARPLGGGGGDKLQLWIPLRRLTAKARRHRDAELRRLRGDAQAVARLETADAGLPAPASPGLFASEEALRRHWRGLVDGAEASSGDPSGQHGFFLPTTTTSGQQSQSHSPSDDTTTATTMAPQNSAAGAIQFPASLSGGQQMHVNCMPWIWADADPTSDVFADDDVNMDVDNEADWLSWLESAKSR